MLIVIEKENDVKKAQKQLERKMNGVAEKHGTILMGGKGWHTDREVNWNSDLGIWWTTEEEKDRYWNSFGTGEPKWNIRYPHSITCEINLFKGKYRRTQGAVAIDENGKLYLLHRGRIGGGREGIGKALFMENFNGEWETVRDGDSTVQMALIAAFDSERFPQQVANFVNEVERIKNIKSIKIKPTLDVEAIFKEEFSGIKKISQIHEIEAKCDHGLVVNSLAKKLKYEGFTVGNRAQMDLYIVGKNMKIEALFEIKTDTTIQNCYNAIGQLLFHSCKFRAKPVMIAVFPSTLGKNHKAVFEKLGINILTYRWVNNQPCFSNFKSPLKIG